ncbi:MAG TPA: ATP synthase F1 subunit gamma [Ktedonobacterales bacterium]|jgi:F-type H+-transporting ATPase subunit gamma|nr:ATP synthase F1 subunit gamma [Ktedonobacterales bacterium]
MASTREIRRRIRSVKNVGQITKAVQMVASTKMRRAQERASASRPYSEQLVKLLARLANQAAGEENLPLMSVRTVRTVAIVLVTPDRGLAGALPGNLIRRAGQLAGELRQQHGASINIRFIAVGRKGRDFVLRTQQQLVAEFTGLGDQPSLADVRAIARAVTDVYVNEEVDQVYLVYPRFVSTATQVATAIQLLPIQPPTAEAAEGPEPQYEFEPDAATIFAELLPRYLETQIYQPLLESIASYYSAQMLAMKNATDNASDLVADLTLSYNKARQAAITTQILEVVAGAGG